MRVVLHLHIGIYRRNPSAICVTEASGKLYCKDAMQLTVECCVLGSNFLPMAVVYVGGSLFNWTRGMLGVCVWHAAQGTCIQVGTFDDTVLVALGD